jgi:hypothetical protein
VTTRCNTQQSQQQRTTATTQQIMVYQVILVGFLPNDNGRSCSIHPFECGNALVLAEDGKRHGVGMKLRMWLVDKTHLAGYQMLPDKSDGCRVCFAAQEFAVGQRGQPLDGCTLDIKEMVLPDNENSAKRHLFHRNLGYAIAQVLGVEEDH